MRSRPNSSGHGLSEATQSVAGVATLAADGIELPTVARELVALRLDHVGWSLRDETVVGEHALGPVDLLLEPLDLRGRVAVRLDPLRPDDGFEDPQLVSGELGADAASTEDSRRILDRIQGARVAGKALVRLEPGSNDQPRLAGREVRPDLLGHVRHHRVQELQ